MYTHYGVPLIISLLYTCDCWYWLYSRLRLYFIRKTNTSKTGYLWGSSCVESLALCRLQLRMLMVIWLWCLFLWLFIWPLKQNWNTSSSLISARPNIINNDIVYRWLIFNTSIIYISLVERCWCKTSQHMHELLNGTLYTRLVIWTAVYKACYMDCCIVMPETNQFLHVTHQELTRSSMIEMCCDRR